MNKIRSKQIIRRFVFEEWGGSETVVWNTTRCLIQNGYETEIIATCALSDISTKTVEDVPIKRFSYFYPYLNLSDETKNILDKKSADSYSIQLYRYLLKNKEIDILHSHSSHRIANTVRLAAGKNKIPYVISFQERNTTESESEINEIKKPFEGSLNYGKLIDLILKNNRFLKDADGIICIDHDEYLSIQERFPDKIVTYLSNGVDINKFKITAKNDFRMKYKIARDADLILCVSRIDYRKNQIKLIELLNLLNRKRKNTHLLLIGPITSKSYYQMIQKRIKELKVEDRVTIIPRWNAADPELAQAYNAADFFILPSIHEPFSIVILEAWACRLPVIAHKVGGLQKLISDGHTGLFFQNNSLEDLAAQYDLLKNRPGLRVKLIHNAYDEVCNNYSWQNVTEKLLEFYQKVIEKYKR